MIDPEKVLHPNARIKSLEVLLKAGDINEQGDSYAVALLKWDDEYRLAIRWNGDPNNPEDKGGPTSRGYPTWFVLPRAFHHWILAALFDHPGVDMQSLIWARDRLQKQALRND